VSGLTHPRQTSTYIRLASTGLRLRRELGDASAARHRLRAARATGGTAMATFDFLTDPLVADDRALGQDVKTPTGNLQRPRPLDPLQPLWDVLRSSHPAHRATSVREPSTEVGFRYLSRVKARGW
jgi:hypothetical protein